MVTPNEKNELKKLLVSCLKGDKDIRKVIIFGSFITSDNPKDMDVAVFQESSEEYLTLSLKYRKMTRLIAGKIPLDIFPVKPDPKNSSIVSEIENGEVIYER